jgi:hypothetical protein
MGFSLCKPGFSGLDLNPITETFKIFNHGTSDPDLDLNDISKLGPSKLQLTQTRKSVTTFPT